MMITKKKRPKVLKSLRKKVNRPNIFSRRDLFRRKAKMYSPAKADYQFDGPSELGLDPYLGPWTIQQAGHLLRRTTFGPTYAMMKDAVNNGMNATIDSLMTMAPEPSAPVNYYYTDDPNVAIGESWLTAPWIDGIEDDQYAYRHTSIRAWQMDLLMKESVSIQEKMTLFWHNHFVTSDIDEPVALYRYIKLLRANAMGNFKQLTKDITVDAAMLSYLNGNENIAEEPNENYARELLELFTIGKGPLVGPGDYTNYTEEDVVAVAKIMTGWYTDNDYSYNPNELLEVNFYDDVHDQTDKQLSPRFGNAVIANNGADEYKDLIDVVFQQDEVARFLVRKLYQWFVYYKITPTTELNVIEPLAQILRNNDYNIQVVLETLLKSEHFYDVLSMGCVIQNPIDFTMSSLKQFNVPYPDELNEHYAWMMYVFYFSYEFGMEYFLPPSVAGWKAYYQSPGFYRIWINSVNLDTRRRLSGGLIWGWEDEELVFQVPVIDFLQSIDDPANPNSLISEFATILFPLPLAANQLAFLKGSLLQGLPDFEWTTEYNNYVSNPDDINIQMSLEAKLRNLLFMMSVLPERHLS